MVYAIVKKYATNDGTEENHFEDDGFTDWEYRTNDHYGIYDKMMELTADDHQISSDAASWCELAGVGEIYEFDVGEIEIMEID